MVAAQENAAHDDEFPQQRWKLRAPFEGEGDVREPADGHDTDLAGVRTGKVDQRSGGVPGRRLPLRFREFDVAQTVGSVHEIRMRLRKRLAERAVGANVNRRIDGEALADVERVARDGFEAGISRPRADRFEADLP